MCENYCIYESLAYGIMSERFVILFMKVFQKKEASTSTSKADGGDNTKLTKFNSMTLIIDSG